MEYKFKPRDDGGIVKKIEGGNHYSTHIPPFNFEIDESQNMFIGGKEYIVDYETLKDLFDSGYSPYCDPQYITLTEEYQESNGL